MAQMLQIKLVYIYFTVIDLNLDTGASQLY
jgi:hypothetical protein